MMHRAWSSIVEVPYCFSRSYIKLQGHTALKIVEFDPNWAFPDCNSSLNSPMAMKCCTKLETAKERCPIVFQGHSSNFKVTRYKTSPILTQIGRFRTIGRSQLSNPSDLPCSRSSVKFQGHAALKIVEFDPDWAFPDCNSSLNSPMAMKCYTKLETAKERCPIVFQGHPSNFKVTKDKTSPILTQIGRFRTIGRSQLSNPSDLPCFSSPDWNVTQNAASKNVTAAWLWPSTSITLSYEPANGSHLTRTSSRAMPSKFLTVLKSFSPLTLNSLWPGRF